ncbi:MAG: COG4315 family predicted lipoprotein [Candidatus Dormibacteria bacterium]
MRRIVLTLAGAAVLAACGAAGPSSTAPPASGPASTSTTIATATTPLGAVLTDSRGFTLYYFLPEKNSTIGACTGGCLSAWPPLQVTGTPTAVAAATGTLATVSIMLNGAAANEVTYNGWPLHTFASDTAPGQTNGNGVGGKWFAAMPGTTATATGASTGSTPAPATATPSNTPGGYGY